MSIAHTPLQYFVHFMSKIWVIVIINWQLQVASTCVGDGPSLHTLQMREAQSNGLTKKQIRASAKPKE